MTENYPCVQVQDERRRVKGKQGKLKLPGSGATRTPTGTNIGDGTACREDQSTRTARPTRATLPPLELTAYASSLDAQPSPQGEHGKATALMNTGLDI